jgi:hypothetical protein
MARAGRLTYNRATRWALAQLRGLSVAAVAAAVMRLSIADRATVMFAIPPMARRKGAD